MGRISAVVVKDLEGARKSGLSVPEISEKFSLPKSTVWRLTHLVRLDPKLYQRIQSRRGGSTVRRKERQKIADVEAELILRKCSVKSSLPLVLCVMYWAEGTKSSFVFTNTDPMMIRLFLYILRKQFHVSNDRLQVMLRFGNAANAKREVDFWRKVVDLPRSKISLNIHPQYNKTTTAHGLCRITVSKGAQLLKIVQAINRKLTEEVIGG